MKKIKDVAHLYLGCQAEVKRKNDTKASVGTIVEVTKGSNHGDWVIVNFDEVVEAVSNTWQVSNASAHYYFLSEDSVRPILRPLSDMTYTEALDFALMCMDSRHHLDEDSRVTVDEFSDVDLQFNDGGLLVDEDIEVCIGVSIRCFEGTISIRKDGSITCQREGEDHDSRIDDIAEKVLWLLSNGFDIFGLIESGVAIEKAKVE